MISVYPTSAAKTPAQAPKTNPSTLIGVAALDFEVVVEAASSELAEALATLASLATEETRLDAADENEVTATEAAFEMEDASDANDAAVDDAAATELVVVLLRGEKMRRRKDGGN